MISTQSQDTILNKDQGGNFKTYFSLTTQAWAICSYYIHMFLKISSSHQKWNVGRLERVFLHHEQCIAYIPIQFITFLSFLQYQIYYNSQNYPNYYNLGYEDKLDDVLIDGKHYQCLENSSTQLKLNLDPYLSILSSSNLINTMWLGEH